MDTLTKVAGPDHRLAPEITHLVRLGEWPIAICGTDISDEPEGATPNWCAVCADLAGL